MSDQKTLLEVKGLKQYFDISQGFLRTRPLKAVDDVSFTIRGGETRGLVGESGCGKTTVGRSILHLYKPTAGKVIFNGEEIQGQQVQTIMKKGLSFITDDGSLFPGMSVKDNLFMGAYILKDKARINEIYEKVLELFPRLKERLKQTAGSMSGGERKMLAIARGLMSDPKMMLIDEPSLGLAPNVVYQVFETLDGLTKTGVTILLVEQNVNTTLQIVKRAYVLEQGSVATEGMADELLKSPYIQKTYLGIDAE